MFWDGDVVGGCAESEIVVRWRRLVSPRTLAVVVVV